MSWFDAASFTSYAKTALASAQKSIDKVLDIEDGASGTDSSQATAKSVRGMKTLYLNTGLIAY